MMSQILRSSEIDAIELAFEEHASALFGYFARRLEQPHEAADLLSETFLVAWRRRRDIKAMTFEMRPWLFGVARKVLSQHRRQNHRRHRLVKATRETVALIERTDSPDSPGAEVRYEVRRAIASLNEMDQEIVKMVYWDGLSQNEVATILKLKPSSVRSRVSRARSVLRHQLAHVALDRKRG